MLDQGKIMIAYDRKRTSTLTLDEQPGAHTGSTRQYIPGYSDSNIVFLNTSTGNDANTGASIAQALLTYSAAATAAGSTKKIRLVNSATLTSNINKPTEATIGTTSSIASTSMTAPVDAWTQAATPSFGASLIEAVEWSPQLKKYVAGGASGKVATSTDGDTWTQHTAIFSADTIYDIIWVNRQSKFYAAGTNSKFAYSTDGQSWTESLITGVAVSNIYALAYSPTLSVMVAGTASGEIAYSSDNGSTWQAATFNRGGDSVLGMYWSTANEKFYAACFSGEIYNSADGVTWTAATTPSFSGDPVYGITCAENSDILVAVGGSFATPKIAYSTDGGDVWTQSGTIAMSGARANYVLYNPEIGKFVAFGNGGQIAHSSDGDTWTLAATPSFGGSAISDACYSPLYNEVISAGGSGKIAYSTAYTTTISASVAGFSIQAVQYSGTVAAYNCTLKQPGTTAALSLNACRLTESGAHISNNAQAHRANLVEGDIHITCTPASQNAVALNLNTIAGVCYIHNASVTGYEQIRDNIVEGGIQADYAVTVSGRDNTRGTSTNCLFGAQVTHNDPKFVDETDYKLQFQTNGYTRNSLAAGRSAIYYNSAGDARDVGAWSYVESNVTHYHAKNAYISKPSDITVSYEETVSEQQGDNGPVSVYTNPGRIKEILTIQYGSTQSEDRAIFDYIRTLTDKGVKLQIFPEFDSNANTVTANGAQSAGVEFLTVDAVQTYNGMFLTISGKRYWVMRASPSADAATKLILDRQLEDAVTDNQVITTNYPPGAGEYQFSPPAQLNLKYVDPDAMLTWMSGQTLRFVREWQP